MEFEPRDRFLRDLNPDLHFKATFNGYRLTSAVFRDRRVGDGRYECSVDAERIAGDNAEAARIARGHGEWGVGRVSLDDARTIGGGDVAHDPMARRIRPLPSLSMAFLRAHRTLLPPRPPSG